MYSETTAEFIALAPGIIIQTHGRLPNKLLLRIFQAMTVIDTNFSTGTYLTGDLNVSWLKASQVDNFNGMVSQKLERQLQRFNYPKCSQVLDDLMPVSCCPFCSFHFMDAETDEALKACVICQGIEEIQTCFDPVDDYDEQEDAPEIGFPAPCQKTDRTLIYHPAFCYCSKYGQRLKIWSEPYLRQFPRFQHENFLHDVRLSSLRMKFQSQEFLDEATECPRKKETIYQRRR